MGERPTILLADDEEAITAELQPFLERAGFSVLVARDGEAALQASLASDPDLIVLDVLMPRLDGREVLGMLREVEAAVRELPGASERRLRLSLPEAPWPLPAVRGDVDLLFVAVHNLATNAIKFTRPGDTIEIRAGEDGDAVVIEVADTGPGIPRAELEEVWQELARGEAARGVPGTGLGLPLVRTIVARHGGEERIRSRVGQGTVVSLRLPALEPSRDRHPL